MISFFKNKFYKIFIFIVGFIITIFGIIMLFTPGQGILTILFGLGILATEFLWAKHLYIRLKEFLIKKGMDIKSHFKKE